jgi:hypothetical protein
MFERVLQLFFVACRHRHTSQPFSASPGRVAPIANDSWEPVATATTGCYVVCLDCGKRFDYDWNKMRIVKN